TRFDTADAEHLRTAGGTVSAAISAVIAITAVITVAAAQALLHSSRTLVDRRLAVYPVIAIAIGAVAAAKHLVQYLADDIAAVRIAITVTVARIAVPRIILRRRRRCRGEGRNRDTARQNSRDCPHDPLLKLVPDSPAMRTATHFGSIVAALHVP